MPADRYEGGIEYLFNETNRLKQRYIKLNFSHVMQQTRVPESGNISITNSNGTVSLASDYTPPPKDYSLVGLETGAEMDLAHRRLSVILGVNNLFNVRYRDYMNAFRYFCDDMGRNITLRVKVPLIFKH
jgi:iron complex outermembrane receptor protein